MRGAPIAAAFARHYPACMPRAHRLIGWLSFAVFLATGFYLHFHVIDLIRGDESARFTLRANHIYILMGALLNLVLAIGSPAPGRGVRGGIRKLGHVLILAAPAALFVAFVREGAKPTAHLLERPLTVAGVFALVLGVLFIVGWARPAMAANPSR